MPDKRFTRGSKVVPVWLRYTEKVFVTEQSHFPPIPVDPIAVCIIAAAPARVCSLIRLRDESTSPVAWLSASSVTHTLSSGHARHA
jgi:hypothetical protein